MSFFKPIAAWLGRLSVSRKLTLIYLLDLTAVIYISGILIHEKYLAIDFARKEIVGIAYSDSVRELLMAAIRPAPLAPAEAQAVLQQFALQRARHDATLNAQADSAALVSSWQFL